MSQHRNVIVNFQNYVVRSESTRRCSVKSKMRQARLPLSSLLAIKSARLERLSPTLAAVIERLVDDMLDEVEGRRP